MRLPELGFANLEAPLIEEKTKASNNVLILDRGVHGSQVLLTLETRMVEWLVSSVI